MSKRCCAVDCFNSVLNNKTIEYFSFPKSEKFGKIWAVNSGRQDLLQKSIKSLIKYYLCSNHFTDDCFKDGTKRTILKRNLPHSIAIPTIFKNNLSDFHYKNKHKNDVDVKVHNFIVINKKRTEEIILSQDDDDEAYTQETNENKNEQILTIMDPIGIGVPTNENKIINIEIDDSQQNTQPEFVCVHDEHIIETLYFQCRLCGNSVSLADRHYPLFENGKVLKEIMTRVFLDTISENDGKSQTACHTCASKIQFCFKVIKNIDESQRNLN